MTTTEQNKIIDEFNGFHLWNNGFLYEEMTYHSDWNNLIPVVEKIESISDSESFEVDIFGNCCDIGGRIESVKDTKIGAVVDAVIQFIEWYNEKK
jgi:hypothetical protein